VRRQAAILLLLTSLPLGAAEVIPPAPKLHFNDYAGVSSAPVAQQLNQKLADFERESSDQVVVAVFPKMQSDSSIEDYTVRVARSWQVGLQEKNNGVVLFVFTQDRKMFIQVGYGLEGRLTDALCKRIIEDEIKPRFRAGDYNGGLTAGVNAIVAAAKGEYQGTGRTVAQRERRHGGAAFIPVLVFIFVVLIILSKFRRFGGGGGWFISGGGGGWSSGGGGWSGGGGGFSGGGGSFGGGGAGGSW